MARLLAGFSNVIEVIEKEFGAEIKEAGTTPAHVMMSWWVFPSGSLGGEAIANSPIASV
jgi:hypothetical protein